MEKFLENTIDNGLESISSQLHMLSVGVGIVLFITGIIFVISNRGSKGRKRFLNGGLFCIVIGIIAVVSGFMQ